MKRRVFVAIYVTLLAVVAAAQSSPAFAKARDARRDDDPSLSRAAGPPVMAVVALNEQHVTIYDAEGKILRAPVSTGQTGYETPAGIYSIIEKNREHYSNLYDDASMPFMQRITWSGIALHAGPLPGRPASHGCVRMPYKFAEQLFDLTRRGMRVVVVRDDMRPVEFAHASLFKPGPVVSQVPETAQSSPPASGAEPVSMHLGAPPAVAAGEGKAQTWREIASARKADADAATKAAEEARRNAVNAKAQLAQSVKSLRIAEHAMCRAEAQVDRAEDALAKSDQQSEERRVKLEEARIDAQTRLGEARVKLEAVQAKHRARSEAVASSLEAAKAAVEAKDVAVQEARLAQAKTAPVSVFISRKTGKLYVRQAFQPVFESEVTIRDPEAPIGTVLYTALDYIDDGSALRWSALSMYADATNPDAGSASHRRSRGRHSEPNATDEEAARAALDRISIPADALDKIREVVSPGSSLIISDEPLSNETGKGTDFVVLMSGEPQGGIKIRRRDPDAGSDFRQREPYGDYGYRRAYPRSRYFNRGPFGWW